MSEFMETLKPRRLGAEVLARLARERRDGELTWIEGGRQRQIYFKAGRPELVVDREGNASDEKAHVIAVIRAFATAAAGQCIFELLHRPLEAKLNLDTLGETLVALALGLRADQLEAIWVARRTEVVMPTPAFEKFAAAVAQVGGAAVTMPQPGLSVGALIAGAPLEVQRAWATLISLGAVTTQTSSVDKGAGGRTAAPVAATPVVATPVIATPAKRVEAARVTSGPQRVLNLPDNFEARGLALEIERAHRQLAAQDHYQILGVEPKATVERVREAYFTEAKKWHSDRFADKELPEEFLHKAEEIFQRVGEAQAILSDPDKRKNYDFVRERAAKGLPTDVNIILEAEGLFRKGQALVRRGEAVAAEPILRQAIELNKGEAEFWVYFGFAVYGAKGQSGLAEAREAIKKGLEMNAKLDVAHEFLGRIARVEGQINEARRELNLALEMNPKNTNAERELRLINMRAGKETAGGGKGLAGLLGGLRKK